MLRVKKEVLAPEFSDIQKEKILDFVAKRITIDAKNENGTLYIRESEEAVYRSGPEGEPEGTFNGAKEITTETTYLATKRYATIEDIVFPKTTLIEKERTPNKLVWESESPLFIKNCQTIKINSFLTVISTTNVYAQLRKRDDNTKSQDVILAPEILRNYEERYALLENKDLQNILQMLDESHL